MPSYLDLAVITVVLVSGMLALLRGFTREVLAILSWVAAAAAAYFFYPLALPYIKPYVSKDEIALAASVASVFFVALIAVSLITVKLSDVILDFEGRRPRSHARLPVRRRSRRAARRRRLRLLQLAGARNESARMDQGRAR